jgi:metal-responsive CopG/Arc/MetJ family transcriptional regulator
MPRPRNAVPATKFLVSLSGTLAVDLEAFCRAHFDAPRMEVIRRALTSYLGEQLDRNPELRKEHRRIKAELTAGEPLRLVTESEPTKR